MNAALLDTPRNRAAARRAMAADLRAHTDHITGEVNHTALAEAHADRLDAPAEIPEWIFEEALHADPATRS